MKIINKLSLGLGIACSAGILVAGTTPEKGLIPAFSHSLVNNLIGGYVDSLITDSAAKKDTALRTGTLKNGLTYYIKSHDSPKKEAKLKLIVMAGSLQEDDDQLGYAHFVEHMAFNGTKNFHKREIIEYVESIGLKFGADVNAYTTFDRTVYELTVPTDKAEYVSTAIKILSEWAGHIDFDSLDVVDERGVITEEWRARKSKQGDLMEHHNAALNSGSRFQERMPIGTPQSIANAQSAGLKRFYRDWYRPNLMAVVFVGDYSSEIVESEVKTLFSGFKNPASERKIEKYSIPYVDSTVVSVIRDSMVNFPSVNYMIRFPKMEGAQDKLAREAIVFSIFSAAINQRLGKLARSLHAPFRSASVGGRSALDGSVYLTFGVVGRQQSPLNSLETLMSEVDKVARFGLDSVEFNRIKTSMLTAIEKSSKTPVEHNSNSLASLYSSMFFNQGKTQNSDTLSHKRKDLIPTITQEEIKQVASLWKHKENRYFLLSIPDAHGVTVPETESLLSVIEGIEQIPLTAYVEEAEEEVGEFVGVVPEPGDILEKIEHSDSIQEWKLSNGITVWLRQQPLAKEIVQIYGQSKGGYYKNVDKVGLIPSLTVGQTIGASGAGRFTAEQLRKMIGTRDIYSLSLNIDAYEETVNVLATNSDLETGLQLMRLYLKEPRIDTAFLEKEKARAIEAAAERISTAEGRFHDTVSLSMSNYHPYTISRMSATADSLNPEASLEVFKDRFSDMSDFDFIITGGFNYAVMDTIVRNYIASLPGGGRKEEYSNIRILPPVGTISKRVYGANSASAMSIINFSGDAEFSRETSWEITLLAELIRTRLTQVLREDMGGVYSPGVRSAYSTVPSPRYSIEISFASDPDRADELVKATMDALHNLQDSLMSDMYVGGVRALMLSSLEQGKHDWMTRLRSRLYWGYPTSEINNYEWIEKINPETVRTAARKFIDLKNYKLFQLFPGEEPK